MEKTKKLEYEDLKKLSTKILEGLEKSSGDCYGCKLYNLKWLISLLLIDSDLSYYEIMGFLDEEVKSTIRELYKIEVENEEI